MWRIIPVLLLALGLGAAASPAQAATLRQVSLSATVSGSSVTVAAVVAATTPVTATRFGVCVRDVHGGILDFPTTVGATITVEGTRYAGRRSFAPGTYSYRPCAQLGGGWQAAGVAKTFTVESGTAVPRGVPGAWSLIFEDDFDGTSLDPARWRPNRYDGGPASKDGPFNPHSEAAYFTAANVSVASGSLALAVTQAPATVDGQSYRYASGTVSTEGRFELAPDAYFEARVRIPEGDGLWPSFWAVPAGRWPPEIDGFEFFGTEDQRRPAFNFHDLDAEGQHQQSGTESYGDPAVDYRNSWHTYGVQRQGGFLVPWLDGVAYPQAGTASDDRSPLFLILSLSVQADGHPATGSRMLVDHVRAWSAS